MILIVNTNKSIRLPLPGHQDSPPSPSTNNNALEQAALPDNPDAQDGDERGQQTTDEVATAAAAEGANGGSEVKVDPVDPDLAPIVEKTDV